MAATNTEHSGGKKEWCSCEAQVAKVQARMKKAEVDAMNSARDRDASADRNTGRAVRAERKNFQRCFLARSPAPSVHHLLHLSFPALQRVFVCINLRGRQNKKHGIGHCLYEWPAAWEVPCVNRYASFTPTSYGAAMLIRPKTRKQEIKPLKTSLLSSPTPYAMLCLSRRWRSYGKGYSTVSTYPF